jgi:hypothetical protein
MRLFLRKVPALGAPLLLLACATLGPPKPPSLDLPKPPADLRATRKGDKVTLTWTVPAMTTDRQAARSLGPTRICRSVEPKFEQCGTPAGEAARPARTAIAKKTTASYADVLPSALQGENSSAFISYAVEVLNADGRGAGLSNQVRVPSVEALPPPKDFTAHVTGQGVVLNWMGVSPSTTGSVLRFVYRVYRRLEDTQQQFLVGEVPAGTDQVFSLTDSSIEWEKTFEYHGEAVTIISSAGQPEAQVEGDDSPEVKVFADDVFPPAVPSGLQAVFSGPGQQSFIDLIWAPVTDVDLDGYYIYRHEEGAPPVKLNIQPVKTPAYRDTSVAAGKNYLYSVSAVDVRGNESARSEEAGERVP